MRNEAFTEQHSHEGVDLTIRFFYDEDACIDDLMGDNTIKVAYLKRSHYTLGTEQVDEERMHEIGLQIDSGELIGLPVYAYVHSGVTIRCGSGNPFSCPWDSGMSGYVYMDADAADDFSDPERALRVTVDELDKILRGEVYGYEIEDEQGNYLESCWGFVGDEWVKEAAHDAAQYLCQQLALARRTEAEERSYWDARGVVTEQKTLAFPH